MSIDDTAEVEATTEVEATEFEVFGFKWLPTRRYDGNCVAKDSKEDFFVSQWDHVQLLPS
jgi:hypothetical protein